MSNRHGNAPDNTTAQAVSNPKADLLLAMAIGSGDAIRLQEKRGQDQLIFSDTLPAKIDNLSPNNTWEALRPLGIEILGPVEGDKLFQYVKLPEGWEKAETDHYLWSELLDDRKRVRARIFYKAACYDREAFIRFCFRYRIIEDYDKRETDGNVVYNVMDGENVVFITEPLKYDPAANEQARSSAEAWLDENFPKWRDLLAYWD